VSAEATSAEEEAAPWDAEVVAHPYPSTKASAVAHPATSDSTANHPRFHPFSAGSRPTAANFLHPPVVHLKFHPMSPVFLRLQAASTLRLKEFVQVSTAEPASLSVEDSALAY
jgi:hypothetical protein